MTALHCKRGLWIFGSVRSSEPPLSALNRASSSLFKTPLTAVLEGDVDTHDMEEVTSSSRRRRSASESPQAQRPTRIMWLSTPPGENRTVSVDLEVEIEGGSMQVDMASGVGTGVETEPQPAPELAATAAGVFIPPFSIMVCFWARRNILYYIIKNK